MRALLFLIMVFALAAFAGSAFGQYGPAYSGDFRIYTEDGTGTHPDTAMTLAPGESKWVTVWVKRAPAHVGWDVWGYGVTVRADSGYGISCGVTDDTSIRCLAPWKASPEGICSCKLMTDGHQVTPEGDWEYEMWPWPDYSGLGTWNAAACQGYYNPQAPCVGAQEVSDLGIPLVSFTVSADSTYWSQRPAGNYLRKLFILRNDPMGGVTSNLWGCCNVGGSPVCYINFIGSLWEQVQNGIPFSVTIAVGSGKQTLTTTPTTWGQIKARYDGLNRR